MEWLIDDGHTAWLAGATAGGATLDDDPTVFKTGVEGLEIILAAGSAAGIIAYSLGRVHEVAVFADDNLATLGITHMKYWAKTDITVAAGAYQTGLSDAADGTIGATSVVDTPAMTADTWYRMTTELNATQAALTSVSAWMINYVTDTDDTDSLFVDDVRLCKYTPIGASSITVPDRHTINNANGDNINTDLWYFPYRSRVVTINSDVGLDVTFYCGPVPATWTATDVVQAVHRVPAGIPTEFTVEATSMSFVRDHDLHKLAVTADATGTLVGGKVIVEVSQ